MTKKLLSRRFLRIMKIFKFENKKQLKGWFFFRIRFSRYILSFGINYGYAPIYLGKLIILLDLISTGFISC